MANKLCPFDSGSVVRMPPAFNGRARVRCTVCNIIVDEQQWEQRPIEQTLRNEIKRLDGLVIRLNGMLDNDDWIT